MADSLRNLEIGKTQILGPGCDFMNMFDACREFLSFSSQSGKALSTKHKAMREAGTEPGMNIFVNCTPEELERKRQQKRARREADFSLGWH